MKKIFTVVIIVGGLIASTQVKAQDERATKNGFSINVELGIPGSNYGTVDGGEEMGYSIGYGLQVGNRWYLKRFNTGGIALMANWFSYHQATNTESIGGFEMASATIEMTFLELGAMYSYPLNEDMSLDGYYNIEPTLIGSAMVNSNDNGIGVGGFGFGHAFGAAFRYKVLNFGIEYNLGAINGTYSGIGSVNDTDLVGFGVDKVNTSTIKILLGVKF